MGWIAVSLTVRAMVEAVFVGAILSVFVFWCFLVSHSAIWMVRCSLLKRKIRLLLWYTYIEAETPWDSNRQQIWTKADFETYKQCVDACNRCEGEDTDLQCADIIQAHKELQKTRKKEAD